jgi:hypothetical protein
MKKIAVSLLACISLIACKKDCPEPEPQPSCATDLTKGLLAYYPFNGNFNDESGNGLTATAKNGAFLSTDFLGRTAMAAGFDGVNDYVIVPGNAKLNAAEITLSFQVMVNTLNRRHVTISRIDFDDATGLAYGLHQSAANDNRWSFGVSPATMACAQSQPNDPALVISNPSTMQAGRWYNLIATFGSSTQKLYVDGILVASRSQPFNAIKQCSNADLMIGGWWASDVVSIDGKLDEVRLYNRVLSDCEIAKLAETFKQ